MIVFCSTFSAFLRHIHIVYFQLLVDDLLVYNGTLGMTAQTARGILPNCTASLPYHTILFTDNKKLRQQEKHTLIV